MTPADPGEAETPEGPRWVLHVDLDQFLAAVEMLRRPELVGRPIVVGGRGDPTERGVVSTASYAAREFGIRSGMPLRTAARKCPEAVFLPVDFPVYEAASTEVMTTLREQVWDGTPVAVEVLGWDEAFVERFPSGSDPHAFAARIRQAVLDRTRLHCSVGIGNNKVQAKIATDFGKPDPGVYAITDEGWLAEMGDRPTRSLWGVGSKTAKRLEAMGVRTVAELAATDTQRLADEFGPTIGPWIRRLGRGVDTSPVDPTPWVPRAHGREETFQTDLETREKIEAEIRRITRRVVDDIDREGRPATRVALKIRFKPFDTFTRIHKIAEPSNDPDLLGDEAVALLDRLEMGRPVRLLGVRLEMVEPEGGY